MGFFDWINGLFGQSESEQEASGPAAAGQAEEAAALSASSAASDSTVGSPAASENREASEDKESPESGEGPVTLVSEEPPEPAPERRTSDEIIQEMAQSQLKKYNRSAVLENSVKNLLPEDHLEPDPVPADMGCEEAYVGEEDGSADDCDGDDGGGCNVDLDC